MARREERIEHLLRRAGFGVNEAELDDYVDLGYRGTIEYLLDYEQIYDAVDSWIGQPGYAGMTIRGEFQPTQDITHARQRWLFRMLHTGRPLQEKMTLYWHHHFATAYTKIAGLVGAAEATRMLTAKPSEDAARVKGQIELLREYALGNFRDLLIEIAKDVAMLYWLDGRSNVRTRPQENFARELMELFSMGVGHYVEEDVYAGARVFTGWNVRFVGTRGDPTAKYEFIYNSGQHDTTAKTFSFPIYPDGNRTIPARAAADGMQDGIDLINAVARHPATGRRLARRLWGFFVSEIVEPPQAWIEQVAGVYYTSGYDMKAVVREILTSPEFTDPSVFFTRYSWPVEFVVRAIKEVGWSGYSLNDTLTPLTNMGQLLYEPPDVNGWELGPGWVSTGGMLARVNWASALATNQRFNLRNDARQYGKTPNALVAYVLDRLTPAPFEADPYDALLTYARSGVTNWTGADAELLTKTAGLVHLVASSGQYQFV